VTALALSAAVAVNLPVNAVALWLACRLLRVGAEGRGVGYRRAFLVVLAILAVGWPLLAVTAVAARALTSAPLLDVAVYAGAPLGLLVPFAVLKIALGAGWWRTLGVFVVWRLLTFAHVGPTWLLVRPYVLDVLAGW
jgi:hypothetical protein